MSFPSSSAGLTRAARAVALAASLLVAWLVGASAFAADALKVAIGQREIWHGSPASLGARVGIFQKHGLELEILYTEGAGQTMQPVISGNIDIGVAVGTLGVFGAYAKGAPIRIIGAESTGEDAYWRPRYTPSLPGLRSRTRGAFARSSIPRTW